MIQSIDHVVIVVHELDKAIADYTQLGFTVTPGGRHADGLTHNALIAFEDGSYLELIAFLQTPPETHMFYRPGMSEGMVTYALLPGDIDWDVADAKAHGLDFGDPKLGGRIRPDGQRLEWKIALPRTPDLPFLCGDVTPRSLRVPEGEASGHKNRVRGIASIGVLTNDLQTSRERYRALLGSCPVELPDEANQDGFAGFKLGNSTIVLFEPAKEHEAQGDGPRLLALQGSYRSASITPVEHLTHGVHLRYVYAPVPVSSIEEEYLFVSAMRCYICGGQYNVEQQALIKSPGGTPMDRLDLVCRNCGEQGSVSFDISSFFSV